jgi:D-glycero-D-manno-heptose 1,7-bisphosphate phosphatase
MRPPAAAPPVFLDRDGTVIVEKFFLKDPGEVALEARVAEGLRRLQEAGHPLIVVSNQSGIARGLLTEDDARRVNARADAMLREAGVQVLAWYLCPHSPETVCGCRKPLPGMALTAAATWDLALTGSYVIGDKRSDVELADAIGGTGILVTSGHGAEAADWARAESRPVFGRFDEAAEFIVNRERLRTV